MKKIIIFFTLNLFISFSATIFAVPAYPYPISVKQPDGSFLSVILKGDEFHHYHTTEDGYLITKDKKGVFNYAKKDAKGKIIDTQIKANDKNLRSNTEKSFVQSLPVNPDFSKVNMQMRSNRSPVNNSKALQPAKFPRTGSPRSLVILVNFSDLSFVTPNPNEAFTALLNLQGYSENGGTGSARDYFRDNSTEAFDPQFDVVGPYTLPNTYKYYGQNDVDDNDSLAVNMIVDACKLAFDNGIDFSTYDTDGDNIVDNVFVYYAGYNEAEWGGVDRVWPHRRGIYPTGLYSNFTNYSGNVASVTFNGKRVEDYACSSELRGSSGSTMAGIGTFTHEFGHVLGLADMYATDGAKHFTLSQWNIMDDGAYLNDGRTPPSYNSFERFQLGYLTPTLLSTAKDVTLNPLNTSNQAYLISQSDYHNLNPAAPSPSEFFLLENRQKTGWDKYLPGHGMLIYRINYNQADWDYNQPNNDPNKMGVDIMEADGIASSGSMGGDPFPGTSNITSYIPYSRNGSSLTDKPITSITETNGVITFIYKGGSNVPILNASNIFHIFTTKKNIPSAIQMVSVSGQKLVSNISLSFVNNNYFEMKKETDPETAWTKTITLEPVNAEVPETNILIRYLPTEPSYFLDHKNTLQVKTDFTNSIKLNLIGQSPATPEALPAEDITYQSFKAKWQSTPGAIGYLLTVTQLNNDGSESILDDYNELWTTETTQDVYNLISDKEYHYKVKASKFTRIMNASDTTYYSDSESVRTLTYPFAKELRVVPIESSNGEAMVFVPAEEVGTGKVFVFNTLGQKLDEKDANSDIVKFVNLPKNVVLIFQSGKQRRKMIVR